MDAFADLTPQRNLVAAYRLQWLRVELAQTCEVTDNEGSVIGMLLEEEVSFDGQALELTRIVSRSMGRRLGANLR